MVRPPHIYESDWQRVNATRRKGEDFADAFRRRVRGYTESELSLKRQMPPPPLDEINVTCSGCGETTRIAEYNKSGTPFLFFRCECGAETELHPLKMNLEWWVRTWNLLIQDMRKEFRDPVVDWVREYIIRKRNYTRDREYLHEGRVVPQSSISKECEKE